jgi:hypothetical protein
VTALTVPDVLRRAETLIAGHWSPVGFEQRHARYCPIEAIATVASDDDLAREAWEALEESIGGESITRWNEASTEAEVRAALLAAAQRAEAGS